MTSIMGDLLLRRFLADQMAVDADHIDAEQRDILPADAFAVGLQETQAISARLWQATGLSTRDMQLAQVYDAFSPFVYLWLEALGFCPIGEAHRFVMDGGIDSADPRSIAVLSGGGAIGSGRLHGLPQLLECYLQLAGRAGDRQREVTNAVFSYSAPYFGGCAVLTNDPD